MKYVIKNLLLIIILIPILIMLIGSFMGENEIVSKIGTIVTGSNKDASWTVLPDYPTLSAYVELIFDSPGFFVMFWNSMLQTLSIIAGQLLVGVPAAWAFAKYEFKGKRILYIIYIILMVLPFQVTMVSSYLVLNKLDLIDTHLSIIMPGIFSTLPVFILTKFFKSIPNELIEAAQIDGAGDLFIFTRIGVPLGLNGIIAVVILNFIEYWSVIEQPLLFLKDKTKWPLALYLPNITTDKLSIAFVASVAMVLPVLLIFINGQDYLEQGIIASGIKE